MINLFLMPLRLGKINKWKYLELWIWENKHSSCRSENSVFMKDSLVIAGRSWEVCLGGELFYFWCLESWNKHVFKKYLFLLTYSTIYYTNSTRFCVYDEKTQMIDLIVRVKIKVTCTSLLPFSFSFPAFQLWGNHCS